MVALALQADGWYLRSDIIWHKPNPMPESVTDRPTKSHEYLFLMSKAERYFYDAEAIKEKVGEEVRMAATFRNGGDYTGGNSFNNSQKKEKDSHGDGEPSLNGRNRRTVWTVPTSPYSEAHFATFPPDLIKPCILAGTSAKGCCPKCGAPWERVVESMFSIERDTPYAGSKHNQTEKNFSQRRIGMMVKAGREAGLPHDNPIPPKQTTGWQPTCDCFLSPENVTTVPATVLDCFGGSGTTGQVAIELGRRAILIELNPKYVTLIENRTHVTPGLPLA